MSGMSTKGSIISPPETTTGGFLEIFYRVGLLKRGVNRYQTAAKAE
jgi:hypothetical protein